MANDLPPALAAALRPALPDLAQDIIVAIGSEVPAYARPLEGPFGRALRIGVERAPMRGGFEQHEESALLHGTS